jgi:hypothetical protein
MDKRPEKRNTPEVPRLATFRYLCRLAREEIAHAPTMDDAEWNDRIRTRAMETGHRDPQRRDVYRVIDLVANSVRHIRRHPAARPSTAPPREAPNPFPDLPRSRGPADLTSIATIARASTPSTVCGNSKPVSGRSPLVCNRPAGHEGDHGLSIHGLDVVRWGRE